MDTVMAGNKSQIPTQETKITQRQEKRILKDIIEEDNVSFLTDNDDE